MATEALRSADPAGGEGRQWYVFFPVIFGVIRSPAMEGDESSQPADRVVMVNPMILRSGGGFLEPISILQEILGADQISDGPPPASKASVEALRTVNRTEVEAGKEESEECAVCLDRMWDLDAWEEKCEVVKEMPCGHKFHAGCIEKWLNMHGICPLCRHRMPEERDGAKKGREERQSDSEERRASFAFNWTIDLGSIFQPRQAEQQHHHHPIIDDLD